MRGQSGNRKNCWWESMPVIKECTSRSLARWKEESNEMNPRTYALECWVISKLRKSSSRAHSCASWPNFDGLAGLLLGQLDCLVRLCVCRSKDRRRSAQAVAWSGLTKRRQDVTVNMSSSDLSSSLVEHVFALDRSLRYSARISCVIQGRLRASNPRC